MNVVKVEIEEAVSVGELEEVPVLDVDVSITWLNWVIDVAKVDGKEVMSVDDIDVEVVRCSGPLITLTYAFQTSEAG